ncbi:S1/P1 nuclease [Novosphingobium piscinae]|uniref:S1/P1 nuclease n=1 Tax=Novosphingobium piscinae TaxID=1507448 RepID=A0A7X1FZ73_9SPHN|nr:S1/P1 nuclease [Novosphingobium piscinae]MBC2669112.1 S1/P1 nuclease [Novosphingobium piscinae]
MRSRVAAVLAVIALWAAPAQAWWEYGHQTIAAVAMANVRPATRTELHRLLRAAPALGTPECPAGTLEDAAYWPDCLRKQAWRWAYTFPWHYQTMPICKPFDPKANCANGNCVSAQIERNRRILADRRLSKADRLEALAFLAHFVGDIHMPLHSGDNEDGGANGVKAAYGQAPGSNLHAIWDGLEAERAISSASPPLVRRYSKAERTGLSGGTVADWGRESWQLARTIYARAFGREDPCSGGPLPRSTVWTPAAIEQSLPDARRRIVQGGLRLARVLDEALGRPAQSGRSAG